VVGAQPRTRPRRPPAAENQSSRRMVGARPCAELPAESVATTASRTVTRRPLRKARRASRPSRRESLIRSSAPPPATWMDCRRL
jgi:hypothetical protein